MPVALSRFATRLLHRRAVPYQTWSNADGAERRIPAAAQVQRAVHTPDGSSVPTPSTAVANVASAPNRSSAVEVV